MTTIHKNAEPAALAAQAAYQQGKFWEFHDKLFANQAGLSSDTYMKYARELGLDVGRFGKDMNDPAGVGAKRVEADKAEADSLGLTGTPAFFINGHYLSGAQPFEAFAKVIDSQLGGSK